MVDVMALSVEKKAHFERYRRAIESYLAGGSFKEIKTLSGIDAKMLLRVLRRCLLTAEDGEIYGWRALLFHIRIKKYERIATVKKWNDKSGLTGCFTRFLEQHPKIKSDIIAHILKKPHKSDRIYEAGQAFAGVYSKFKDLCLSAGVSFNEYPFNTDSKGSASLRRLVKDVVKGNFATGARLIGGDNAASKAKVGVGIERLLNSNRPYDVMQLDEHKLDFIGTVRIQTPAGSQFIALNRFVLVLVVDENLKCVLGYHVAFRKEVSAEEILLAISNTLEEWKPRELRVNYLKYANGAGLPSGVIPKLRGACCAELKLDNSLAHWSSAITSRVAESTGMSVNFGPVSQWSRRAIVESIFGILERNGFHRISSSMGTGPGDPSVKDPVGNAIKHRIEYEELLDIIDVSLANFNAAPSNTFAGRSKLSVLSEYLEYAEEGFLPRFLPKMPYHVPDMNNVVYSKSIQGSLKDGGTPYVELLYARYTNPMLANSALLIGKQIRIHLDPRDGRTVRAFFEDGSQLGILTARGNWGLIPHTIEVRKEIGKLMRLGSFRVLHGEDVISAYMRHLSDKAVKENQTNRGRSKISPSAIKAVHVSRATGLDIPFTDLENTAHKEKMLDPKSGVKAQWPSFLKRPDFAGKF